MMTKRTPVSGNGEDALPAADSMVLWPAGSSRSVRARAFIASFSGTSLEYYDFAIYSSAAALIFGKVYFAASDPATGIFNAFATYAVGFVARPLGGIFFGRLGDRIGRKKVLVYTLMLVGVATFLIGILPGYRQIGSMAPALLVVLRFAQGVGVGGEWGGAVLISSEHGTARKRGFWGSAAQLGPPIGTLLANGVLSLLIVALPPGEFVRWGWRVAFLLSAVLVGFGLWIRNALEETPVYRALDAHNERSSAPVRDVLASHKRALASSILARVGPDVLYAMFAVFILAFATQRLGIGRSEAVAAVLVGSAVQVPMIPAFGGLSDRFGRQSVYALGAVGGGLWSIGFFTVAHGSLGLFIGVVGGLAFHAMMYGPQAAFIAEQFPTSLRYTGSSLAYTFAGLIGGAIAPMIFSLMLAMHGHDWQMGAYIFASCVVTLLGLWLARPAQD